MTFSGPRTGRIFFWASAIALALSALILLGYEATGRQLAEIRQVALPLLLVSLLAGLVALVAWWRDRQALARAAGSRTRRAAASSTSSSARATPPTASSASRTSASRRWSARRRRSAIARATG